VVELSLQLSFSHFIELLSLETGETRHYYANEAVRNHLGTKEQRRLIS